MGKNKSFESGKTLLGIVRVAGWISLTLIILGIGVHFFFRTLFMDSAVEDTIKELTSRAISASSQLIAGKREISSAEFGNMTRQGYTAYAYPVEGNFFEISLLNVSRAVCEQLQKGRWTQPTSIYINGALSNPNVEQCEKFNHMSFEFSRDLGENVSNADKPRKQHCQSDADCSGCSVCQNGMCYSGCSAGESCGMNLKGRAVCCSNHDYADPFCCPYTEDESCCWGRNNCCPKEKPISLADGTCVDCYDTRVFALGDPPDLQTCLTICPNRVPFGSDELCMLPICTADQFMSRDGSCTSCQETGYIPTSEQECRRCPNRKYTNGRCGLPCPADTIQDQSGACIPCQANDAVIPDNPNDCTQACRDRHMEGNKCVLNMCPINFIPNKDGVCVSCDEPGALFGVDPDICAECITRTMAYDACVVACEPGMMRRADGQCVSCNTNEAVPVPAGSLECSRCPDRMSLNNYCFATCSAGQFRDAFGACRSCQDLNSYPVTQTASCAVCPNRAVLLNQDSGKNQPYCTPQYCPMDYFADMLGSCHDCFVKDPITKTDKAECEQCPNRFWSPLNNTCFLKPTCAPGDLIDSNGQCQSCQSDREVLSVIGRPNACDACPDRYVFGNWCRRCPTDLKTLATRDGCQKCGGDWDNRIALCSEKQKP